MSMGELGGAGGWTGDLGAHLYSAGPLRMMRMGLTIAQGGVGESGWGWRMGRSARGC